MICKDTYRVGCLFQCSESTNPCGKKRGHGQFSIKDKKQLRIIVKEI